VLKYFSRAGLSVDRGDKFMNKLYWIIGTSMIAIPIVLIVVLLITAPVLPLSIVLIPMLFVIVAVATFLFIFRPAKGRMKVARMTSAICAMYGSIFLVVINILQITDKRDYNTLWWIPLVLMTIGLALVGITFFSYARADKDRKIFWLFSGSFVILMVILGTSIGIVGFVTTN